MRGRLNAFLKSRKDSEKTKCNSNFLVNSIFVLNFTKYLPKKVFIKIVILA